MAQTVNCLALLSLDLRVWLYMSVRRLFCYWRSAATRTPIDTTAVPSSGKPPNPQDRPHDDGSTLVINVLVDGWLINCNVGDSRTAVGYRPGG